MTRDVIVYSKKKNNINKRITLRKSTTLVYGTLHHVLADLRKDVQPHTLKMSNILILSVQSFAWKAIQVKVTRRYIHYMLQTYRLTDYDRMKRRHDPKFVWNKCPRTYINIRLQSTVWYLFSIIWIQNIKQWVSDIANNINSTTLSSPL